LTVQKVMSGRFASGLIAAMALALVLPAAALPAHAASSGAQAGPVVQARASEPVVITGSQIPTWSRSAPTGVPAPWPSGVSSAYSFNGVGGDNVRSAHNGIVTVPPDTRTGVDPDQIAAYRWDGASWTEIPVQVDQMFPYFLANGHSSFSVYSGTDEELTYAWNPTSHDTGEESWKKVFGGITGITDPAYTDPTPCDARYEQAGAGGPIELAQAEKNGVVSQPDSPGVPPDDYTQAMVDPVDTALGHAELTDVDQIAMMAGDAGLQAPAGVPQPAGTFAPSGDLPVASQQITVTDPTATADGSAPQSYIYLFLKPGGSSFTWQNGYVHVAWNSDADQWIDEYSFSPNDPERIGTSNTSYGPNIGGDVCVTAPDNDADPPITTPSGQPRPSIDRQPRDGVTVSTPTYSVAASGRWMVRRLAVTAPGTQGQYGPNLISRWKGRAFQSSPDSSISVVGFEDEQTNWELNSTLLGWKVGPVRAIREVWGADSGTNVTKTEIYYRDSYDFVYHVRVHPIPPDGLYTSWDFRYGVDSTYYNQVNPAGIPIDGTNAHNAGEIDQVPVSGQPAYFNTCVPTQDLCSALDNPEEVAGPDGGIVFVNDVLPSHLVSNNPASVPDPSTLLQPATVPYYRDDACFDDGTGDAPVPRPHPGDASTSADVQQGYVDYWLQHGAPSTLTYADLTCKPPQPGDPNYQQPEFDTYQTMPFQGAIGELGVHYFFTGDTDNAFAGVPLDEVDAEEWVYPVPLSQPANLISATASAPGEDYGLDVVAPLQTVVAPFSTMSPAASVPEVPWVGWLPLFALPALLAVRRRYGRRE
jgi:hypothetical protein